VLGHERELGGPSTSRLEQPHKRERRHTLTYKVFNLYFSNRCGTSNSHLHTTLPLKCESINSLCSPFKRKLLLACIVVVVSPQTDRHCLYRRCYFLRNRPAASVVPFVAGALIPLLDHLGELERPSTSKLEQPH